MIFVIQRSQYIVNTKCKSKINEKTKLLFDKYMKWSIVYFLLVESLVIISIRPFKNRMKVESPYSMIIQLYNIQNKICVFPTLFTVYYTTLKEMTYIH